MTRIPTAELLALKEQMTPGPWSAEWCELTPCHYVMAGAYPHGRSICEIEDDIFGKANTRAIAHLPDLIDENLALRALLDQAEAALEVTRGRMESLIHDMFDGVWTQHDMDLHLAEADATLAAISQCRAAIRRLPAVSPADGVEAPAHAEPVATLTPMPDAGLNANAGCMAWVTHNPGDLNAGRANVICPDADVIVLANIETDVAHLVVAEHNAALRARPAGVTVEPLVWGESPYVTCEVGQYGVGMINGVAVVMLRHIVGDDAEDVEIGQRPTMAEGIALAQADRAARIRAALRARPVGDDLRPGLIAAEKIAAGIAGNDRAFNADRRRGAGEVQAAIRAALTPNTAQEEGE